MDKRIIKTRSAIFNAVFELSTEKPIDRITVIELCKKAGINKSTFYLHYKSIDECFQKCFDYFTNRVLELSENISYADMATAPEQTISRILDVIEQNLIYFDRFQNSVVYDSAIVQLKEKFVQSICNANNINIEDNYHEVTKITFVIGGCADVILKLLPNFNRPEIEKVMVDVIKRKQ